MYVEKYRSVLCCLLVMGILLNGCKKEDQEEEIMETAGQIPGMGGDPRPLQGEQFRLPPGVSLVGNITGQEEGPTGVECVYDGQGGLVSVQMTLRRDSIGGPMTVEFPEGLIIISTSEFFQKGLLIEKVLVELPPKDPGASSPTCQVTLLLSCLNEWKHRSNNTATYQFGPVTSSAIIRDFIQLLSDKKIRYSDYDPADAEWPLIDEIIQEALWNLTDGEGLTEDDLEQIGGIPSK